MFFVLPTSKQNAVRVIPLHVVSVLAYQPPFKPLLMKYKNFQKNRKTISPVTIVLIAAAILMTGCKKFLDVPPKDKVPQAKLFSNEEGFKEALIGVYLAMDRPTNGGKNGLYTNNLTMGMLSTLAYDYDNAAVSNAKGGNATGF